jgi:uncharacterized phage protein gp47/JayE
LPTQSDIVTQIRAALDVSDPDLDTSTGSVTRKIVDAVSEAISEAYIDNHVLTYQYDIDSKTDADLDAFVQLFGLARFAARRAGGTVIFSRAVATDVATIPLNSQVNSLDDVDTSTGDLVGVLTLSTAVLNIGDLTATVPVQAIQPGPDGNLPPNSLTQIGTPTTGILAVTNPSALTGGAFQETDSELRDRWKKTVFRSMAGTEAMFLGVATNDADCPNANVVGATKRRREQVQVASGVAQSTATDVATTYAAGQMVGRNIDNGDMAVVGIHYTWDSTTNPPRVVITDTAGYPDGTLLDLDFAYVPKASRNDVANAITNRVDVWCAGSRAVEASQSLVFRNSTGFSASSSSVYYNVNYIRPDGTNPTVGNIFIPLAYGPIITVPSQISIGATTYGLADAAHPFGTVAGGITYAYQIVHEDNAFGWSPTSRFGLEWYASNQPAANAVFAINAGYTYNDVPTAVQREIDRWKLAGTDAKAHQAKRVFLKFNLAIIYDFRVDRTITAQAIDSAISGFLGSLGFDAVVQASDILQVVHNVPGVDAVRFLNGTDISGYVSGTPNLFTVGIQKVVGTTVVQSYVDTNGRAKDVILGDDSVPAFGLTVQVAKAENTWTP